MSNFQSLGVSANIIKGINELGIIEPSPIQKEVIPALLGNKVDLIGQAQTGTGKTAAYGIPLLERIKAEKKHVQALILCPTRELGQQVAKQLFKYTKYTHKIFCEAVYGGEPIDRQITRLNRPTHIVVATPGRLIDLVKRKAVDLNQVQTVVLDEADEMLSMGFKAELDEILGFLPDLKSKWLFSATMPHGIRNIINVHLSEDAIRVHVSKDTEMNRKIMQEYLVCEDVEKLNILMQFLRSRKDERGIVFCKTKNAVKKLALQLQAKNIAADGIHGDLKQLEREKVLRKFKKETLQILIATDLAARGLDVPDLAFVVHYQWPDQDEYFTHRSGRTARAGKEGLSLALVNTTELKALRFIEKKLKIGFKQLRAKG